MDSLEKDRRMYEDQHPNDRGILLANQIHELCTAGLLISEEYEPTNLRPASYTLRIGEDYIDSDGKLRRLTDEEESFVFEKNSIIFVSTKEKLKLPFYIVARFNIRVTWVYNGVLLGTGPQVDPGFSGYLSCPLYNLTNLDITIKRGEDFATIDFEKTTNLLNDLSLEDKKKIVGEAKDKELISVGDQTWSFYKLASMKRLQPRKAHRMVSSLFEMREELRTWRRLGIGSVIAFFGLTLSLLGFGANLYRQNSELNQQIIESRRDLQNATERITKMEGTIERLAGDSKPPSQHSTSPELDKHKKNSR